MVSHDSDPLQVAIVPLLLAARSRSTSRRISAVLLFMMIAPLPLAIVGPPIAIATATRARPPGQFTAGLLQVKSCQPLIR
jgi:hypothetical protein